MDGMTVPPPPEGEPVYVPEPYPPPHWGNPYAPYPPPGYPAMGYAPPPATSTTERRIEPGFGWTLFAVGILTAIASLLPWAVYFGVSVAGTRGDGTVTVLCSVIISAIGLIIGLGQGSVWAPVTALIAAALVTITALADIQNVGRFVPSDSDVFTPDAVTVGPGLWLTLIGGLLGIGVTAIALLRRSASSGAPRPGTPG